MAALLSAPALYARPFADIETGLVFSGYNDVRIPGDTGTKLSLSETLDAERTPFIRARFGYTFLDRHTVSALVAPLRIHSSGTIDRDTVFMDKTFTAGNELSGRFRFDSYRLSYRYDFSRNDALVIGAGLTGKIRDASIRLDDGVQSAEKSNTGFVPLVNFRLLWNFHRSLGFLFEGDALAAKQGRAEDLLAALVYRLGPGTFIKAGYRLLEGGADNDEVYTFSMFHYAVAGFVTVF